MIEAIVRLIDEALARYGQRNVVTGREYADVLLDLRLACTIPLEQQQEGDFQLGELPEGAPTLVGVDNFGSG